MGVIARMKSVAGGPKSPTIASASTVTLPDDSNSIYMTGTNTITTLRNTAGQILPGRQVTIARLGITDKPQFTNTAGTTTSGQMDIGSATEPTVLLEDSLTFIQQNNGTWRMMDETAN